MKKAILFLLATACTACVFVGCSTSTVSQETVSEAVSSDTTVSEPESIPEEAPAEESSAAPLEEAPAEETTTQTAAAQPDYSYNTQTTALRNWTGNGKPRRNGWPTLPLISFCPLRLKVYSAICRTGRPLTLTTSARCLTRLFHKCGPRVRKLCYIENFVFFHLTLCHC